MEKIFRFATFEADRERYQLRRGSRTIKLERIPLELLFLLLEHAGRLVPREQIVARLWGDDVFLDTERSINTAVRKVRASLGDNPGRPRFIETTVGMGYRFIAPLLPTDQNQSLRHPIQTNAQPAANRSDQEGAEIRLRGFSVETSGAAPVLTCHVMVGRIDLGRLPLLEVELPEDVTLPLTAEDRLLVRLHGIRVTLTAKATQALHAFSISALQSGLRTRITDLSPASEPSHEKITAARETTNH